MQNYLKRINTRKESLGLKKMMIMMAIMKGNSNYVNTYNIKNSPLMEILNKSYP
jgi:hypothetical protein